MTATTATGSDLAAVRETYQRDGYVLVKGLIEPGEARYMRQELHDLLSRASGARNGAWKSASSVAGAEGKQQLQGMHDLQFYCSVFSRMIVDPRFTGVAAAVLDAENVQLHHTKAFIKPPERGRHSLCTRTTPSSRTPDTASQPRSSTSTTRPPRRAAWPP